MKAKDLIKILQGVDPESVVSLSLGREQEYRDLCAKAELAIGDCLNFLTIDRVEIYEDSDEPEIWAEIVLKQDNILCLEDNAEKFDEQYKKL